jgi:Mrp family chromosome partitioning ATPase
VGLLDADVYGPDIPAMLSGEAGRPVVVDDPDSDSAARFRTIAALVAERLAAPG